MSINNVVDIGAIGDGNPANAVLNTAAFQKALDSGGVYIPASKGFVVNNGVLKVKVPNTVVRGDASMGSTPDWGPTSTIIGIGSGHTLEVAQGGGCVSGLVIKSFLTGQQSGEDASLLVRGSLVSIHDIHIVDPNIGISCQLPSLADGEFWIKNVLVDGAVRIAGIDTNIGNAAINIQHAIMDSTGQQPPYGIRVTSSGEVVIGGGSDIINMGACLGIVPGLNGVQNQYVNAIKVSDSFFDGGNGKGCVVILPTTNAYVATATFSNVWASTANNGSGVFNTDGFYFDGSFSAAPGLNGISILDINLVGCVGKAFVNHCGVFAKSVRGLSVLGSSFGGNVNGIQTYGCSGIIMGNKCGNYVPPPVGSTFGGNAWYGILAERSQMLIPPGSNLLDGNGIAGIKIMP